MLGKAEQRDNGASSVRAGLSGVLKVSSHSNQRGKVHASFLTASFRYPRHRPDARMGGTSGRSTFSRESVSRVSRQVGSSEHGDKVTVGYSGIL